MNVSKPVAEGENKEGGDSLNRVAKITVIADPNSIENPLDGDCSVNRFPKFLIILYP